MVIDQTDNPLGESVAYDALLPFRWQHLEVPPAGAAQSGLQSVDEQAASEALLRTLLVLDDARIELGEEHEALSQELVRLDFKINLMLDMVAEIYRRQLDMPSERQIRLGGAHAEWHDSSPPQMGERLRLEIYLSQKYSRPIYLLGQVIVVEASPAGDSARVVVELIGLSEPLQAQLEKFLFRQHRRAVAHARRATDS
ncbi:MAG: hypothetical protein GXP10_09940 [Gammaproteobacteria bacterium]|nr:hypothetical protein [Gammaproteobacteria bacterium]